MECESGVPTQIIVPAIKKNDPCKQLTALKDKTGFTEKMTTLKNNIPTGAIEKGFLLFDDANVQTSQIIIGGGNDGNVYFMDYYKNMELNNLDLLYRTYGTAHNHLKSNPDHVGVHSPEDLNDLLWSGSFETGSNNPYKKDKPINAIDLVITNIGLFALKITDMAKLDAFCTKYKNMVKDPDKTKFEEFLEKFKGAKDYNIQPTSTYEEQVTGFLRFMQDEDLGIELYEGNKDTYGSWKKLQLVDNGTNVYTFTSIPCNL